MKKYIKAHSNYYEDLPEEFTVEAPKTVDDAKARRSAKLHSKIQRRKDEYAAEKTAIQDEYERIKAKFFDIDRRIQSLVPDAVEMLSIAKEIYDVEGEYSDVVRHIENELNFDTGGWFEYGIYFFTPHYFCLDDVTIYPDGTIKYCWGTNEYSISELFGYYDDAEKSEYNNDTIYNRINLYVKFLKDFPDFLDRFYAIVDEYADDV